MTTWWASTEWQAYEQACGLEPGTRVRERAAGIRTQVVDLRLPPGELWRDVRRSYHSLIHKGSRRVCAVGASDLDYFKAMHTQEAGRQTRPDASWELMRGWMPRPLLVLGSEGDGGFVAFAGFYLYGMYGYYGHAAAVAPNVNHALVWQAMMTGRTLGVRWFEVGYLDGSSREIFRRGFGGCEMLTSDVDRMVTHES